MIPGAPAATEALHRSKCICLHCCHQGLWQALAFGTPDVPPLAFFLPFWSDFFASHHQIVSARRLSLYRIFCLKNPNCYLLLGVIYIYIYIYIYIDIEWASALVPPTPLFGGSCRERERERGRERERERAWWKLPRGIWRVVGVLRV